MQYGNHCNFGYNLIMPSSTKVSKYTKIKQSIENMERF